jgi:hypothetical protein
VLQSAFQKSLTFVIQDATDIDPNTISGPAWGSHWIYRCVSEAASIAFAAVIAAGIFRGRGRTAALISGFTISVSYVLGFVFLLWLASSNERTPLSEPWYQNLISGALIFAAPLIALSTLETADDFNAGTQRGFAGINSLHFVWLWIPTYFYALALISPIMHFYLAQWNDPSLLGLLFSIPNILIAALFLVPLYFGVALLSGQNGSRLSPIVRNGAGVSILIFGWIAAALIEYSLLTLVKTIFGK